LAKLSRKFDQKHM